ncbi:tetratricopeptide repeat protein (plasmid) [Azospirillum sp. 412522]|nr:tetratricopeptide repeat protein [Azospirillum sp. 412522]MBY6266533.1 tetratricopeptide repeat protein [Azospirillum sp. 412522]
MTGGAAPSLGLFDDRFPNLLTGFQLREFSGCLDAFPGAAVYSFGRDPFRPYDREEFGRSLAGYHALHPGHAGRVRALVPELSDPARPGDSRQVRLRCADGNGRPADFAVPQAGYAMFAMNAALFRPLFEHFRIPFCFTLYPGGGFLLDDPHSDAALSRLFASPQFRSVIVTQDLTRDYLRSRFGLPDGAMRLIHGGVVPVDVYRRHAVPRRRYGIDKDTLDLCFVAKRYTPRGTDKGYDLFIAAARLLAPRFPRVRFHVVGNFGPEVLDVTALAGRLTFHGPRPTRWLAGFFAGMDGILSANRPWRIARGAFDGFPTTACVEAGVCGVTVFATDPLGMNRGLRPDGEIVILDEDAGRIADRLASWLADPERLHRLGGEGQAAFLRLFGEEAQMKPRLEHLRALVESGRDAMPPSLPPDADTGRRVPLSAAGRSGGAEAEALEAEGRFAEAAVWRLVRHAGPPDDRAALLALTERLRRHVDGEAAAALLRGALCRDPADAELWNHLGVSLRGLARPADALRAFRRGARVGPDGPWSATNIAFGLLALLEEGDGSAAAAFQPLPFQPPIFQPPAFQTLPARERQRREAMLDDALIRAANALLSAGRLQQAGSLYSRLIALDPAGVLLHANLANVLLSAHRTGPAIGVLRRAVRIAPDNARLRGNFGAIHFRAGRLDGARHHFRTTVALDPAYATGLANLGSCLLKSGPSGAIDLEAVERCCRRALLCTPASSVAWLTLGLVHLQRQDPVQARHCLEKALEQEPRMIEAHNNMALVLRLLGDRDGAVRHLRLALDIAPDNAAIRSNLLFQLNYDWGDERAEALFAEHVLFGRIHGAPRGGRPPRPFANPRDPERRLRIGYVSPDFRRHALANFIRGVIRGHDRSRVEVTGYAELADGGDAVTDEIRAACDRWRPTAGLSDAEMDSLIRADGIDILVDLAGHTAGNRLPVFGRRAAPVQATWLGYMNTTGLPAMDYILTGPGGIPEYRRRFFVETPYELPSAGGCYQPMIDTGLPAPPPALAGDGTPLTFGCTNNASKVTPEVIALWSRILHAAPQARLMMKSHGLDAPERARSLLDAFAGHGVAPGRLLLEGASLTAAYYRAYDRIDIALDPFPYNGGTTTFDTLWMGVPLVCLRSEPLVGRVTADLLNGLGLPELVALTPDEYVGIAVALSRDPQRLADYRRRLRGILETSPLMDVQGLTVAVEDAYRAMWKRWCADA